MEKIQQIVKGNVLNKVIAIPKSMQNMLVEITVVPVKQATKQPKARITRDGLRARLNGSHTEYLIGALQFHKEISLEELRAERRSKYERTD